MSKKIRLGYDILSKRATETESGVNIDEALKKITSYKKVPGTGDDNHPDEPRPSTKVIYIVKVDGASQPDTYKEWIWNQPVDGVGNWECIGGTSDDANSWKRWSENRGSTGEGESVYLGVNDVANRDETYVLGKGNTVSVTDETDYTSTDVVEIGSENTATDAANTYQLGRENTVTGNNLANKEQYPHSMAMNLGRNNSITGEGVNIGKDNVSSTFGVAIGQRNQATNASIAIGEDVDSYYGSISIGHGKPSATSNVLSMLSMTIDGEEIPAQRIKLDLSEYTYYARASVFKTASNAYEWGEIGDFSTRVTLYENQALHIYLVGGNSASYGSVTGYFDSNGNFISSTDPSYNIKEYSHITEVNGVPVDFYCSRENGTNVAVSGYFKRSETQPELGTVLNASEYAEWLSKLSIRDIAYYNINVYTADLTAPAMKCEYSGTNRPFYTKYSVYGYRDENNRFIPYNEVTKYKSDTFSWETIPADDLHESLLKPESIGVTSPNTISRNDSIAIGKSMEADTSSFGVGIGTILPEITYERESDAGWIGYTNTSYRTLTLSQVDGSVTESTWTEYNRVWFNSLVDDISWRCSAPARTVMGNSIAIVNNGGSPSYNNYLSGASVGIGNGLKLTDNSFGFGTNLEGDNNSVLVGANLTSQVGGSTLVGRDISVKIGDSDNDGGSINGEYDGGLVAFGMSIAPSPGSVTVGRSGVTTGRGSIAVGASGISATRGSVVYGRNGVSAEGRATAIGTDGISAKNASITVGLDSSRAEDGSATFGINGISAYSGSISIGRDGNSARYGSLALGFGNQAESGSTSVGASSFARSGAFTFGRGMSAESAGISIGTTGGNQASRDRSASGSIVKYKNPDNVFVPVKGSIRVKSGYSIDHVRVFRNVSYDGTTYDYAVLGIDSGYYNSNSTVYLYKNGTEVTSVYRTDIRNAFSTSSEEYWRIKNGSTYSFVRFDAEKTYNELGNLKNLKEYLEINPRTFTQNEQVYVYADGFNYPTTGLTSNNWIPLSSCTFDVYDYWTGVMLGYSADDWNRLTASGGYNKGIAIGANAHAEGCSFAMAPNYDVMGSSSTVSIGNRLNASPNGLPTSLLYDIYYNGSSISANGYSAAIGLESITATGHSFALGNQSLRAYGHSTAIGTDGVYADRYSLSIGCKTNDAYNYSFAIGQNSNFATGYSFAIGTNSNTASGYSLAIGTNSNQARDCSLAIGDGNNAETYSSVFGYNSKAYHNSIVLGKYALAFDYSTSIGVNTGAYNYSTAIGDGIGAYDYSFGVGRWGTVKNYSVSVGESNYVDNYALAMGRWNNSDNRSVAIGANNQSSQYAVAMGRDNTARGENVAIGIHNSVNSDSYSGCHGIAIGEANTSKEGGYNISFGLDNSSSQEAVSIGTRNNVHGWSIALGRNNTSYDGPGGHATIIGYKNKSFSDMETRTWEDTSSSTTYYLPLNSYYDYSWSEQIYTPDEIGPSGYIGSLSFCVNSYSTTRYLNIYLANTTKDRFTGNYDWVLSSSATLVFSGNVTFNVGWNTIPLNTSFQYDDSKNLCVIVVDNTGSYSSNMYFKSMSPGDGVYRSMYTYQDGSSYNPSSSSTYGYLTDNRPFIRFLIGGSTVSVPKIVPLSGSIPTNSILIGALNESNHFNSILIGVGNQSDSPHIIRDGDHYNTNDDDGFMIAIGRENYVGRNYDIAIGCKSVANGGENVSIQHSTAEGYRNLSMFDSTIYGTANAGIIESNIVPLTADDQNYGAFTHNFVVNSRAEYSGWGGPIDPYEGGGHHSFHRNVIFDASLRSESTSTVQENFIFGGSGYQKTSSGTDNTAAICISATDGVQSNIILGLHRNSSNHPEININANNTVMSNFMVLPDVTTIQSLGELHQNQFVFSTINVTGHSNSSSLEGNIVFRSSISGTIERAAENIVFGKSNLYVDTSTIGTRFALHNILLSNSNLSSSAYRSFWDGTSQPCSNNVLIGSEGSNILSCFSYTDSSGGATIENALRVYNFGDNYFTRVAHTFTAGNSNTITGVNLSFVGGHANYITSTATANGNGISAITVLGSQNQVHNTNSTGHLDRLFIAGDQNNVYNDSFDNVILGSQNDIQYNSSTSTDESPAGSDAYPTSRVAIIGHNNHVGIKIHDYAILGIGNDVTSTTPVSAGLVQGSDNVATDGSNIIAMGNGHVATGHNSVAIGSQLISDQWQTVLGKYNEPISGPDRLTDPADEADKALLIVGNGYSDTDGDDWQDETQIHRSNAMVVYANGDTVFSGNVNAANLPPAPSNDGRYALNCIVTNGVPSYSWVPVGTVTV